MSGLEYYMTGETLTYWNESRQYVIVCHASPLLTEFSQVLDHQSKRICKYHSFLWRPCIEIRAGKVRA
jgi:hypothetical protein